MTAKSDNLVWIDLEMTGLDPDRDRIIEIATIVTDSHLRILAEGPVVAIHHPEVVLERMDEWNRTTHGGSGLLERVRRSESTVRDAERVTLDFLAVHAVPGASPMCGNSICQDRRFLAREMPDLEDFFHYRNLDVSTIKELARRKNAWKKPAPRYPRGVLAKFAAHVTSASEGAVTDKDLKL